MSKHQFMEVQDGRSSLICFHPIPTACDVLVRHKKSASRFPRTIKSTFTTRSEDLFSGSYWEAEFCVHACAFVINFYARRVEQASTAQHRRSWALQRDHTCLTISPKHKTLSTLCDVPNHLIKKRQKGNERFLSAARVSKEIGTVPTRHSIPFQHYQMPHLPEKKLKRREIEK